MSKRHLKSPVLGGKYQRTDDHGRDLGDKGEIRVSGGRF